MALCYAGVYFCAIFAAVERFFRAYIPGPVSDVLSKIQLFLPLLAFVSLWCAQVWGLKRGYIEQKYRKTVTVGVTLLPIMTLIFILLFSMHSSKIGGVSMTEKIDYGKDNLASRHTYLSAKTE